MLQEQLKLVEEELPVVEDHLMLVEDQLMQVEDRQKSSIKIYSAFNYIKIIFNIQLKKTKPLIKNYIYIYIYIIPIYRITVKTKIYSPLISQYIQANSFSHVIAK